MAWCNLLMMFHPMEFNQTIFVWNLLKHSTVYGGIYKNRPKSWVMFVLFRVQSDVELMFSETYFCLKKHTHRISKITSAAFDFNYRRQRANEAKILFSVLMSTTFFTFLSTIVSHGRPWLALCTPSSNCAAMQSQGYFWIHQHNPLIKITSIPE